MSTTQSCVLAAGKGARMGGDRPKVLFEAAGKPLIEWVLGALSEAGVNDIVVVVGFKKDEVVAKLPTDVRWAEQSPQLGTGHAVRCARHSFPTPSDNIIVTYGDMPLVAASTYRKLIRLREEADADGIVLTVPITPDSKFGRIVRTAGENGDGSIRRIVEYKDAASEERAIREGNAGVYCFKPEVLWRCVELLKNDNAQSEYYLTDVVPLIIDSGGTMLAHISEVEGEDLGVNTPEDLELASRALAKRSGKELSL